jgi:hypothetical protein
LQNTLLGLSRRRLAGPNTVPSATEVPLVLVMPTRRDDS